MSQNQVTLFKYVTGGQEVTFLDDQGLYDAETIRKHWQATFPELGNCQAETDAKKQAVTVDGAEVEVDRVVTFVKKVGTKGGDLVILNPEEANALKKALTQGDDARQRLLEAGPELLGACAVLVELVHQCRVALESGAASLFPWEADLIEAERAARLVMAGLGVGEPSGLEEEPEAGGKLCFLDAGGKLVKVSLRLVIAGFPRLLAELEAQRDLLKTLLEVAVFYNGGREVALEQVARLEAVIAEATEAPGES